MLSTVLFPDHLPRSLEFCAVEVAIAVRVGAVEGNHQFARLDRFLAADLTVTVGVQLAEPGAMGSGVKPAAASLQLPDNISCASPLSSVVVKGLHDRGYGDGVVLSNIKRYFRPDGVQLHTDFHRQGPRPSGFGIAAEPDQR